MNKNLGVKLIVIIGVLLLFIYGIFGIPSGLSGSALLASLPETAFLLAWISKVGPTLSCRCR